MEEITQKLTDLLRGITEDNKHEEVEFIIEPNGIDKEYKMVEEFQRKMGQPVADNPTTMSVERRTERFGYMYEELAEFHDADDLTDQVDGIIDLIYLAVGTLTELGVKPGRAFEIVHEANMTKVWPDGKVKVDGKTGKILKPPHFKSPEPQLEAEIKRQEDE